MKSDSEHRPVKGAWEQDAYTRWRRVYSWGPGVIKRIKRDTHKRERREAKSETLKELTEWD